MYSLSIDTRGCEFGYELIMCVPYAFFHKSNGRNVIVNSCKDMRPFYYFLNEGEFVGRYTARRQATPAGVRLGTIHFNELDMQEFKDPNYRDFYKDHILNHKFEKDLLVISNKYTSEWREGPCNYLSLECLDSLFSILSPKYDIIYNRPKPSLVCNDEDQQPSYELGEKGLIDNYESVHDINDLLEEESLDYNTLQLILLSKAKNKISVQGGTSIVSSFLGGMNKVYAVKGDELIHNSFKGWYGKFSGCKVNDFQTYEALIDSVKEDYL